ncbi:MAG: YkgJ family cysteine cluster protein [Promethearchaeota archaeon]
MLKDLNRIKFKCLKCGNCCTNPGLIVNLTPRDAQVLIRHLKIDASGLLKFVGFYQVKGIDEEVNEAVRERLVFSPLMTNRGPAYLGLLKLSSGACIFYRDNRCSVYAARPRICQAFPFTFKRRGVNIMTSISAFALDACPGLGQGDFVNTKKVQNLGRIILKDIDEFFSFARWWNARHSRDREQCKPRDLIQNFAFYKSRAYGV